MQAALIEKHPATVNRKGILLLHDNARPHIAKLTLDKINKLSWEVLPHPPYSPDLAPSDFYLFRALQQFIKEKKYENIEDIKNDISSFFQSKSSDFYKVGIQELVNRWRQVVENDGDYCNE